MPLMNVLSAQIRPDRLRRYEELVQELSERAVAEEEEIHWTAHQTLFGETGTMHYAVSAADFSEIAARGRVDEMVERVLGSQEGARWLDGLGECVTAQQSTLSVDRPELSYPPPETDPSAFPCSVLTVIRARPGGQEACEELIRKVAEAIPKVDDSSRMISFQTLMGDLGTYWTVRPLADLSELDRQLPPAELLNQAFGAAEGGLIFRSGLEAIEQVQRSALIYRPDLSNPA
jgi:hypothetical protein